MGLSVLPFDAGNLVPFLENPRIKSENTTNF
jgi:hypothetical protein